MLLQTNRNQYRFLVSDMGNTDPSVEKNIILFILAYIGYKMQIRGVIFEKKYFEKCTLLGKLQKLCYDKNKL